MNYFEQANNLYNTKDYKAAIPLYQKSAELKENECASLYNAAVCFIKLKDFKNAIILLKKAILQKQDSRYFFNLGYCYAMIKETKKALIYFNASWALNNNDNDCEKAINLILKNYNKTP